MPMFTFKKDNRFFQSLRTIYDPQLRYLSLTVVLQIILFIYSFFFYVDPSYLLYYRQGMRLISVDNFFDYSIPLLAFLVLFFVLHEDFKGEKNRFYLFFETGKWQKQLIIRYILYTGIFIIGAVVSSLIYFSGIQITLGERLFISLRAIPNILFLTALFIFFATLTKNIYSGLFIGLLYVIGDYLSAARFFTIYSFGANTFNFMNTYSTLYYYLNRIVLLISGVLLLLISIYIPLRKWLK